MKVTPEGFSTECIQVSSVFGRVWAQSVQHNTDVMTDILHFLRSYCLIIMYTQAENW